MNDSRLDAIRRHPLVGEHCCTFLLSCFSDAEIIALLDEDAAHSPEAAITWAINHEGTRLEQALNYRLGEDDDAELRDYQEFESERKQYA